MHSMISVVSDVHGLRSCRRSLRSSIRRKGVRHVLRVRARSRRCCVPRRRLGLAGSGTCPMARCFDATKAENCIPISGKDRLLMTQIAFFDDPARCAQKANELVDELEQRIADGVSVFPEGTKRILITGTPMAVLEPGSSPPRLSRSSGAAVVCDEMCTARATSSIWSTMPIPRSKASSMRCPSAI